MVSEGGSGIHNGRLLALAGPSLAAFITVDKNLPWPQNPTSLPMQVVVSDARSNELSCLLPLIPALERLLACRAETGCAVPSTLA